MAKSSVFRARLISWRVRCCSDIKSNICNVIFDIIYPSLWLSSYIPSPFYMAVHCSWWQSAFVHSCNMAKPISRFFFILSTSISSWCWISRITLFTILSLLVTPNVLPSQPISAVNVFCSSSFRRHHQSAPYISISITNNSYTAGLLFCWKYCVASSFSQTSHSLPMPIQYVVLHLLYTLCARFHYLVVKLILIAVLWIVFTACTRLMRPKDVGVKF